MDNRKVLVISGPTASGKSNLAIEIAKKIGGIIINADSMQIYKGLPILSAQPSDEEKTIVEHKLYGIFEPNENNTVYGWLELVKKTIDNTTKIPVIVGGTGMYISRLIHGIRYLPETNLEIRDKANALYEKIGWDEFYKIVEKIDRDSVLKLKKNDKHRIVKIYEIYETSGQKLSYFESLPNEKLYDNIFHININLQRDILYKRCEDRFKVMLLKAIDEVNDLLKTYDIKDNYSITKTIGFKEIKNYLDGNISYDDMVIQAIKATKNYAKRQITWFKNQFEGFDLVVNSLDDYPNLVEKIISLL